LQKICKKFRKRKEGNAKRREKLVGKYSPLKVLFFLLLGFRRYSMLHFSELALAFSGVFQL
jgi:hypothetical protein